ncbi:MAG TPA: response regulator [Geobacterales bacterium]|nr:response regulator [Geobacterales bacterium]
MTQRKKLGEIFVERGIITEKTVERFVARSRVVNRRFGQVLEDLGIVTGEELAGALALQYNCRVVTNLMQNSFTPDLFELIPVEVAMENMLFPLKRENDKLALALADPTNTRIVNNIAANNGLSVVPFVATQKEIHAAICKHYLGKELSSSTARTVLVVEDDKTVQTIISQMLMKHNYRVVTAGDGMEAYKAVIVEKPDVVITDKVMPKLDGYGLFDALKNIPDLRHIPVILITGSMSAEDEARAFDKGFFDFLCKPVKESSLLVRVKRAFFFHEHHYRLS